LPSAIPVQVQQLQTFKTADELVSYQMQDTTRAFEVLKMSNKPVYYLEFPMSAAKI
jgi:hypothetical protein